MFGRGLKREEPYGSGPRAEEELNRLQASFCRGMAHPTRVRILRLLAHGEKTVNDLAVLSGVTQANESQHLALLRQLGLVSTRREGTKIYYSVADPKITEACELMRSCVENRIKKSQALLTVVPP